MKTGVLFFCFLSIIATSTYAGTFAEIMETPAIPSGVEEQEVHIFITSNDGVNSDLATIVPFCTCKMWAIIVKIEEQEFDGDKVTVSFQADNLEEPIEEIWGWEPRENSAVGIFPLILFSIATSDSLTLKILNVQVTLDLTAIDSDLIDFFAKCKRLGMPLSLESYGKK